MAIKRKNFKNLLVKNYRSYFKIMWYKWSLGDPLPKLFKLLKKHGRQGRYTITNATSLRNITFNWLTSGFMQLAATGRRRNLLHFHSLFEGKYYLCFRVGITILKNFIWGGIVYMFKKHFLSLYLMIYLPK